MRHLTGAENRGNHNVYVDVLAANRQDLRGTGIKFIYAWEGMQENERPPLVPIEKPAGEFGGNMPIYLGAIASVAIDGAPSEVVRGLRTDFGGDDGTDGNSYGHQSFHVVFRGGE